MSENMKDTSDNYKMPVLFIGHGSPMNIIQDNSYTQSLVKLSENIPKPEAIMVISAHWMTDGTYVTCNREPKTIHDFYGFPQKLYEINYPSPGAPEKAELTCKTVSKVTVECSNQWGLDHASWAVLRHMYPEADIPVFEMSIDYSFNEWHPKMMQHHYNLASELRELRNQGILIIGSGNIVHNLSLIDFRNPNAEPYEWAVEFDEKVKENLLSGNHRDLIEYLNMGNTAKLAVPTLDHYLPMIYAIALQEENETLSFTHEGFQHASVSMRCFKIG